MSELSPAAEAKDMELVRTKSEELLTVVKGARRDKNKLKNPPVLFTCGKQPVEKNDPEKTPVENPCNPSTPPVEALSLLLQRKAASFHKKIAYYLLLLKLLSFPLFREREEKGGTPS